MVKKFYELELDHFMKSPEPIILDRPGLELSTAEIEALFGRADKHATDSRMAYLLRSLALTETLHPTSGDRGSLTDLWYRAIKAVLGRLGYLQPTSDKDDPVRRMSQRLSQNVEWLVRRGRTTYRALGITKPDRELYTCFTVEPDALSY
jgi:hypothetical protein